MQEWNYNDEGNRRMSYWYVVVVLVRENERPGNSGRDCH
jgi:hypothetical protein